MQDNDWKIAKVKDIDKFKSIDLIITLKRYIHHYNESRNDFDITKITVFTEK